MVNNIDKRKTWNHSTEYKTNAYYYIKVLTIYKKYWNKNGYIHLEIKSYDYHENNLDKATFLKEAQLIQKDGKSLKKKTEIYDKILKNTQKNDETPNIDGSNFQWLPLGFLFNLQQCKSDIHSVQIILHMWNFDIFLG